MNKLHIFFLRNVIKNSLVSQDLKGLVIAYFAKNLVRTAFFIEN